MLNVQGYWQRYFLKRGGDSEMTETDVWQLWQEAAWLMVVLAAPVLGVSLLVGLAVSIFQTVTQINEMTLAYVPKMLAVGLILALLGPWMLTQLVEYLAQILTSLPALAP